MNSTADSNIILRLILMDDPSRSPAVTEFLSLSEANRGAVEVHTTTVSEVVYVLRSSRQRYSRQQIVSALETVLDLPFRVVEKEIVRTAIDLYRDVHPDWDDCIVSAYALNHAAGNLLSYDRALSRIPGVTRVEPPPVTAR